MNGIRAHCAAALLALALAPPVGAQDGAPPAQIRSQAEFDAYLRSHAAKPTPLDSLSPGARERFLMGLDFGSRGLRGFDSENLAYDLSQSEIEALLALFGLREYAPESRVRANENGTRTPRDIGPLERRYNAYYRRTREADPRLAAEYANAVARAFDEALPEAYVPTALRKLSAHDLALVYRGARGAARLTPTSRRTDAYVNAYNELERRGLAISRDTVDARNQLLAAHRFDQAKAFTAAHANADLPALPEFRDALNASTGAATTWRLSNDGATLTRTVRDLAPLQILVTAGCHFSVDAAESISADPVLGPVFAKHAQWLVQPPGSEDVDAAKDWNRRFPDAQVEMIYEPAEWTMFPSWSMPAFYIVEDGKVLARLTGWAKDEPQRFREPIIEALRRHGLLDGDKATAR